eukprot:TRINITY_DN3714_c0_g2_i1.p13 TRINITY_DN3714_c0_g2~~TRINITY_DN3714_c0_g2_i1.p13  ORF type:complete len:101 (+),score=4.36 TRINITY_DN3714_c0_g2_i1:1023-1325(+)
MSKIKNQTPNQCATWQSSIQNIERIQNIKSSKVEQLKFQQLKILIQQINKQQKTQQLHIYFVQYILKQEFLHKTGCTTSTSSCLFFMHTTNNLIQNLQCK